MHPLKPLLMLWECNSCAPKSWVWRLVYLPSRQAIEVEAGLQNICTTNSLAMIKCLQLLCTCLAALHIEDQTASCHVLQAALPTDVGPHEPAIVKVLVLDDVLDGPQPCSIAAGPELMGNSASETAS